MQKGARHASAPQHWLFAKKAGDLLVYVARLEMHSCEDADTDAAYTALYAKMASKGFFRKLQSDGR